MATATAPTSGGGTLGTARLWWGLWGMIWLVMVGLTLVYATLPADGYSGDMESFALDEGFLVRYTIDARFAGLQPGDIVQRIDGYSINEWLTGNITPADHWRNGGIARYDIIRAGRPQSIMLQVHPNGIFSWMSWFPRVVVMVLFISLGTFVFYKRPNDGDARRMMLFCMCVAAAFYGDAFNFQMNAVVLRYPLWIQVVYEHLFFGLEFVTAAHFAMSFPKPYSLWARFPRLAPLGLWLIYLVPILWAMATAPTARDALVDGNRAAIVGSLVAQLLVIFAYSMNLRRISDPVQRSQAKWILYSAFLAGTLIFPLYYLPLVISSGKLIPPDLSVFLLGLIPISFAIAILRYRLFSIDLVVNRSLVYGSAVIGLWGLLTAGFLLIQRVFGETSPAVLALLVVIGIVLARPTVRLTQHLVDRYLYRFRFDLNDLARAHDKPVIANPGLLSGRNIAGYELRDVIGHGGMGEVYKGLQERHLVAIKILLPKLADDALILTQFQREAEVMARLTHSHIPILYGSGECEGLRYLMLEHIEGHDLKQHLRDHGRLSLDDALDIMQQVAAALDYMHGQGIIHRDVKPGNIMLQLKPDKETYHVWLTDFGLAKLSAHDTDITGEGAVGTIDYMSPEQIQEQKTIDHRADIYALGVLLYEMLTGEVPYKGRLAQVLFAHLSQPVPNITDVLPDMSGDVAWAIMSAMSKDARDRPTSAQAFIHMFETV